MASLKDILREGGQWKAWVVGDLGVGVINLLFVRLLSPVDMVNPFES
jgi:hypothetical protein